MKSYLEIIRSQQRPFRFLLARILAVSGLCRLLIIEQHGYRLRFYPSNLTEQLWINPNCRTEALMFFNDYPKAGDRVIDVGANIGDTALTTAKLVGSRGCVWAIEPHPRTFRFLLGNLRLNRISNVVAINSAAGRESGFVTFSDDRRDDINRVGTGALNIPVQKLDDLVTCRETIALLKVDVEGYEKPVFEGADNLLTRTQCLHFEISKTHFSRFGYTISDLLKLLESKGFELFRISSGRVLKRINANYDTPLVGDAIGLRDSSDFTARTNWNIQ
jgi:FkbM family methyltransferase